ncbi:chorismate-binding protein [bacterium]|nr:chorismate-binding protein [bacterium]
MVDEIQNLDRNTFLQLLYAAAVRDGLAMAMWMLPNSQSQSAIVDLSGFSEKIAMELERIPAGFVVAPFFQLEGKASHLIKADLYWDGSCLRGKDQNSKNGGMTYARLLATIRDLARDGFSSTPQMSQEWFSGALDEKRQSVANETFNGWIQHAIEKIRTNKKKKIVISRAVQSKLGPGFAPVRLFQDLCKAYPNAFVSLVAIPDFGTWIGATPELLLQAKGNRLRTIALAGTQPLISQPVWNRKELEEQAIVSDFIRECFSQQGMHDYREHGPETMQIGELLHLRTEFNMDLGTGHAQGFTSEFLRRLHPTPAVGGVPKESALEFIRQTEIHDREFYSGFLGPVNLDGASHLFVNLRCLQLLKSSAILYAGSGITFDSVAEQECLETELKLNALSMILEKTSASNGKLSTAATKPLSESVL